MINTIPDSGLSKVATDLAGTITYGQYGRGTAIPTPNDTALGSAIPDTLYTLTYSVSGNSVEFTHTTPSTSGSAQVFTEYMTGFASGSVMMTRSLNGGFTKTQNYDVVTIQTINIIRANT